MNEANLKQKIILSLLTCFLFFLSSIQIVSVICLITLFIAWIFFRDAKASTRILLTNRILLLFITYYLLHAVSLLYSSNISYALFDLQVKLPLLAFPLILAAYTFNNDEIQKLKYAFISGTFVASVVCLFIAIWRFSETHSSESFFYIKLSKFLHPAYFAIYLNFALLISFDELFRQREQTGARK